MDYSAWRSGGHLVPFGAHRAFVRETGEGAPIVFLHGFPTSSYDYDEVVALLRPHHRCVTFDFLGFGASSKPFPYRYRYDEQVELTLAVFREARLSSAVIVAHDYGVTVAQELLARAAEGKLELDIKAVVLLNGGVCARLHRPILVQRLMASRVGAHLGRLLVKRKTFERSLSRVLASRDLPPGFFDEQWKGVSASDGARVMPLLLHYIAERRARSARWEAALRDTRIALSLVWGMADPVSGRTMLDWLTTTVPGARATPLERVGHYPQVESPREVAAVIRAAASAT